MTIEGGLGTFHKVVDKDANAVGGRVQSDTRAFELALSRRDTATAQKYLLRLDELCSSEGSPISTPVTTSPAPGIRRQEISSRLPIASVR